MSTYGSHVSLHATDQKKQARKDQVANNNGGFVFAIDDWARLNRFLILGSEGGSYYASEEKKTYENFDSLTNCIQEDGIRTVNAIVDVSVKGRAPKNDPAIFALALAASIGDDATRALALKNVSKVCRTGTHFISFSQDIENLRGRGRGLRRAIANWYTEKTADQVAYQVLKYRQRGGRGHKNLLRLGHPETKDEGLQAVFRWITCSQSLDARRVSRLDNKGKEFRVDEYPELFNANLPRLVEGFEKAWSAKSAKEIVNLISDYGLTHEMIPDEFKDSKDVWGALVHADMGITALIRNLGKLTNIGLIEPMSEWTKVIAARVSDPEEIKKGRVHPLNTLIALKIYGQGHGMKGNMNWSPIHDISDALDSAFYAGFDAIEPTGKNHYLALDLSGSMTWHQIAGLPITPRETSAAMAMVTARLEPNWYCMGFSGQMKQVNISPKMRLDAVVRTIESTSAGPTDCSLPMVDALNKKIEVDTFVIYTDNETGYGGIHPFQALKQYRQKMGRDARLISVAMESNNFTIADPTDAGMMDIAGFDTSTPAVMAEFAKGNL